MRPRNKQNKIFYNVRLDKDPLNLLKIIAKVEGSTTSALVRKSISVFVDDWHREKKDQIIKRQQDFKEIQQELSGWTGLGGEKLCWQSITTNTAYWLRFARSTIRFHTNMGINF